MTGRPHGVAKYVHERCRCELCGAAVRAIDRRRYRMIAYGQWQPFVDAEPVRRHVRALMAYGVGWMRIARLVGVPQSTVEKLLYGDPRRGQAPSKRIRPETAERLLALSPSPDLLDSAASVDGTGTRRRLQALVAAGWPQRQLAVRLGIDPSNINRTIRDERVYAGTDRAARALYDDLWNEDPVRHGVRAQSVSLARSCARRNGWAPVGAWDDDTIDDPAAEPDWTGRCGTPQGYYAHRVAGTPTCARCRVAVNAVQREQRAARGRAS